MLLKPNNLFFKRPTTTQQSRTKYRYDGLNRRVVKDLPGEAVDVRYLYSGWRSIQEQTIEATPKVLARYVYGLTYLDEVIRMDREHEATPDGDIYEQGSFGYYFVQDLIYSTVALVDDSGAVAEHYWYEPYGTVTFADASGAVYQTQATLYGNEHLFTGQRYCAETRSSGNFGLYYYKNRYYDAGLGRFANRDPAGYDNALTLYQYVGSLPIALLDPTGLRCNMKACTCDDTCPVLMRKLLHNNRELQGEINRIAEWAQAAARNPSLIAKHNGHIYTLMEHMGVQVYCSMLYIVNCGGGVPPLPVNVPQPMPAPQPAPQPSPQPVPQPVPQLFPQPERPPEAPIPVIPAAPASTVEQILTGAGRCLKAIDSGAGWLFQRIPLPLLFIVPPGILPEDEPQFNRFGPNRGGWAWLDSIHQSRLEACA